MARRRYGVIRPKPPERGRPLTIYELSSGQLQVGREKYADEQDLRNHLDLRWGIHRAPTISRNPRRPPGWSSIEGIRRREQTKSASYVAGKRSRSRGTHRAFLAAREAVRLKGNPNYPDYNAIRPGSRVSIINRFGQVRTGRAVMRGPAGWVLNMGGRYGTPDIATHTNVVRVSGGKARSGNPESILFKTEATARKWAAVLRQAGVKGLKLVDLKGRR